MKTMWIFEHVELVDVERMFMNFVLNSTCPLTQRYFISDVFYIRLFS